MAKIVKSFTDKTPQQIEQHTLREMHLSWARVKGDLGRECDLHPDVRIEGLVADETGIVLKLGFVQPDVRPMAP